MQTKSEARWLDRQGRSANYKNCNQRVQLSWSTDPARQWWLLAKVDLALLDGYGVFVIWRNGDLARVSTVLYVGHGALCYQIARCRRELFNGSPNLKITWATVDDAHTIDGIAAYLYHRLRPMWGEIVPWTEPIAANLPAA